jgi:hypothetical protein
LWVQCRQFSIRPDVLCPGKKQGQKQYKKDDAQGFGEFTFIAGILYSSEGEEL